MSSILNNKYYVILLSLLAIAFVGNTIYQQTKQQPTNNLVDDESLVDPILDILPDELNSTYMATNKTNDILLNDFKNIHWPNFPSRNPFQPYKQNIESIKAYNNKTKPKTSTLASKKEIDSDKPLPLLTAIIINKHSRYVVLNTKIMTIGEKIDGYIINSIDEDKIKLVDSRGSFIINLIEPKIDSQHEKTL